MLCCQALAACISGRAFMSAASIDQPRTIASKGLSCELRAAGQPRRSAGEPSGKVARSRTTSCVRCMRTMH